MACRTPPRCSSPRCPRASRPATLHRMIASEHMAARNVICRFAISSNTRERRSRASRAATVQDRADEEEDERARQPLTPEDMGNQGVRPTRRACYKFVALSEGAFVIQVIAGIACSIGFVRPCGLSACCIPSFAVWRSFHLTFQIYYISGICLASRPTR